MHPWLCLIPISDKIGYQRVCAGWREGGKEGEGEQRGGGGGREGERDV